MATTRVQDFYKSVLTRNWTATTGDFNVSVAPTITAGIIVISPNSTTQREIVRYTATGTNQYGPFVTISDVADRGLSGTTAQSHIIGEQVRMNVTAVHWDELLADAVAPTVDVGTTTTLEPGSDATVTNSGDTINATLDFEIPAGSTIYSGTSIPDNSVGRNGDWAFDTSVNSYVWYKSGGAWALVNSLKGATGDGNGIASIVKTNTVGLVDTYTITYDDDTTTTFNVTNGAKGDQGDAGISVVSIIKTNTVGLVDTYTITYSNLTTSTFDVTNGAKGDTGDAATIAVGTVTTLDAGSAVTVVNSGTENAAVFDFGIPEGDKGDTGDIGIDWQGAWSAGTYTITQAVSHNGSSWICTATSTTEEPSISATDWDLIAQKGTDGEGSGDISGSGVENEIAYFTAEKTIDNLPVATYPSLTELSYVKGVTSGIQTQLGNKEITANKVTSFQATPDDTHYPSEKLVKDSLDAKVEDSIVDGHTTVAPSGNAVFDALALKAPIASPTFTGTVTLPEVQLGETGIKLDDSLSADEKWSGITIAGTLGDTIAVGDLVYLNNNDGRWELADANLSDGYDKQLGICLVAGSDGSATTILVFGKVRSASFPSFTVGSPLYMSETAGDITHTAPTTADSCTRLIGFALTADDLMFNPSQDYYTHT